MTDYTTLIIEGYNLIDLIEAYIKNHCAERPEMAAELETQIMNMRKVLATVEEVQD